MTSRSSEELLAQYPDHVRKKNEYDSDKARLEWMKSVIGDVSIREFTIDHADKIMRALAR